LLKTTGYSFVLKDYNDTDVIKYAG